MTQPLKDDLIRGAKRIAEFTGLSTRQIFHAHEKRILPTFKMGRAVCARGSTLRDHITRLELEQSKGSLIDG